MLRVRKYLLATAALATALTLSACSDGMAGMDMGSDSKMMNPSRASAAFNEADVTSAL
ncbi:hypothetical protein [Cryobacterium glaciale]|uniref:hypothetical protein n=1 Tax=Cryobacterium glaciale TaxID=1259145 RepID=UPI00141B2C13|nr:hypothetical protein [Cryobacterium glaciale]